ncbi:MAG: hypothetical protein ACXWBM_10555 [Chthoniobacterales bacterium]
MKTLCDDVRLQIAELLPELALNVGVKAVDPKEPSLPHAKFLIELAEFLNLVPVEKKSKSAADDAGEAAKEYPSLEQFLLEPLDEEEEKN